MSGLDEDDKGEPDGDEDIESADASEDIEDEFAEELDDDDTDGYEDEDVDDELQVVNEALSHRDQNARALAIRRAIEERLEAKRLSQDLDYLDLDLDPDD